MVHTTEMIKINLLESCNSCNEHCKTDEEATDR